MMKVFLHSRDQVAGPTQVYHMGDLQIDELVLAANQSLLDGLWCARRVTENQIGPILDRRHRLVCTS